MQPYVLLDAGGTILFPDFPLLRQLLLPYGVDADETQLRRLSVEWTWQLDRLLRDNAADPSAPAFLRDLVTQVGVPLHSVPKLVDQLQSLDAQRSLWSWTFPWVRDALEQLDKRGFRMSVISNADGRVRQQLEQVGLTKYFEEVFDSHLVGYEKPDVRLFQHALSLLELGPEECLYVGDVYYIDVLGANRAGIAAVHLDAYGLYGSWPGCHLPDIAAIPDLLASQDLDLSSEIFFPLRSAQSIGTQEPVC